MNDFDNIFRQKLEGYTETPPPEVFGKISKNFPKRTASEFISAYKYYLIAAVAVVGIATAIVISLWPSDGENNSQNNNKFVENTTPGVSEASSTEPVSTNESSATAVTTDNTPSLIPAKNSENKVDVLNLNDTIICGSELLIDGIGKDMLKSSTGLIVSEVTSGVKLKTNDFGSHTIIMSDGRSVKITFKEPARLISSVSKTELCYGENITVDVAATVPVIWNDDDYTLKKLTGTKYEIAALHSGRNDIVITTQAACAYDTMLIVNVAPKIDYSVSTKANYCSGNNGQIEIKSQSAINYCKIGNKEISRSGIFTGLSAGTYIVEINYAESCITHDTIVIKDKSKLEASFESTKNAFNEKAYSFHNYTRLDDFGNVQNVDFEWLVNGVVVTTDYNFDYEFNSNGKYVVELVARTGDCESRYSRTIDVVSSDFRIPNVFTPNGDGISDEFTIYYDGTLLDYDLSIYTKSGQLVFHSQQIENSWNGKINGNNEASEGVYFYVITATSDKNEKLNHKGTVQLIRR